MIERRIENLLGPSTIPPTGSSSSSPPTRRPTAPTSSPRRAGAPRALSQPARRQGRRPGPRRPRDVRPRSSPSPTRTRRGRPTRCGGSSARFADPGGRLRLREARLQRADGTNREGAYWRYELWLRESESRLGSVTGGNGSIYAVRREDYVEVDPRFGHDLSFPYLMVQRGRRAVFEPEALAYEKPTPSNRDRVPAQGADVRALLADHAARVDASRPAAGYLVDVVSHRAPPLRQRAPARRPARHDVRARRRRARSTCVALAGQAGAVLGAAARRVPCRATTCSSRWRRPGARELPAARSSRHVAGRRGDAVNRAADVALAGARARRREPAARGRGGRDQARGPRSRPLPAERVGKDGTDFELLKLRTMVVGAETQGAGYAVDRGDPRITRVGRDPSPDVDRRAAAALERVRGEMSIVGPRPTLALPGRALRRATAPASRRAARPDRLGADQRPRVARRGRTGSSSTSGTSSTAPPSST